MTRNPYRQYRRGRRNEPVPLFILPPNDPVGAFFAVVGALFRTAWRYRSELAPVAVAAGTWWAGWRLHTTHPAAWPELAVLVVVLVATVVWGPVRWPRMRKARMLASHSGRLTLAVWLAIGGGWLAAATAVGPARPPLGVLWFWGTLGCGVPWWVNHWRRATVRLSRTVERWPELSDTVVGLAGSKIVSAVVDAWGWTARVVLHRGQTPRAVVDHLASIESALATRPGAVRIEPDPTDARALWLRVIESDPHANPIPWPGLTARTGGTGSIGRPVVLGVFEDGSPVAVWLLRRHVLIGGTTGAGKSGLVAVVLAVLTGCPDVILWGVDLKQGMELAPWASCLHRLATTPEQAVAVLAAGVAELDRRAALLVQHGARVWNPTPDAPALVIVVDEYAELPEGARQWADSIARRGRAVAVTLLVATQRPTQAAMGHGAVRSQMDVRVCLRVRERRDTDLILGQGAHTAGWHAEALTLPGTFLLSAPEHQLPRRARGYLLGDDEVNAIARRHAGHRPPGAGARVAPAAEKVAERPGPAGRSPDTARTGTAVSGGLSGSTGPGAGAGEVPGQGGDLHREVIDPERALQAELRQAPDDGVTTDELMNACGMSRSWVYYRLQRWAANGDITSPHYGRWRAERPTPPGPRSGAPGTGR